MFWKIVKFCSNEFVFRTVFGFYSNPGTNDNSRAPVAVSKFRVLLKWFHGQIMSGRADLAAHWPKV